MRYYLIAGEASGDLHGSNLIKGLRQEDPEADFRFWGGGKMQEAAGEAGTLVRDYKEGAVMGLTDLLSKAGTLLGNIKTCKKDIIEWKPDVVVLIDYPGFNMKMAEFCHEAGIKVFYYIAPKTWASREGRNRKLKAWVDRLFIVFPFEIQYFESRGIPFIYKGNPLLDAVDDSEAMHEGRADFFSRHGLKDAKYVALLAGSRGGEISRMMPVCMKVADTLAAKGYRTIVAGAPARSMEDYTSHIGSRDYVDLVFGDTYGVLKNAEAAIINSGTASLEAALIGTPQVVCWSTSPLTAWVARYLLRVLDHVKFISLGNLIVDRQAFRELIQEYFTVENVTEEITRLLEDSGYRDTMLADYAEIRSRLGGKGASNAVARAMLQELRPLSGCIR